MRKPMVIAVASLVLTTSLFTSSLAKEAETIVSNELEMVFMVSEQVEDTGTSNGTVPTGTIEQITVVVDGGQSDNGTISTATINRTTNTDGTKKDDVTYSADKAQETIDKASQTGQDTARIVIPDTKDEISEINVNIPKETLQKLLGGSMNLEVFTENARIVLPVDSMDGVDKDLFFRLVPIKAESLRMEVEGRAKVEKVVREALGDGDVKVVGRPMTIETNLTSRQVELVLPLRDAVIPTDPVERDAFFADLVIFIEHSDGERVLVRPELVTYKEGQQGLKFSITKFSTFTILNMENWEEYLKAQSNPSHQSYILGYPDQTFRPERSISRAEMAALLSRVGAGTQTNATVFGFADLQVDHWANEAIQEATAEGLINGYPDGTFAPEQSITRAEMAAIVSRWISFKEDSLVSQFSDIRGHWAYQAIAQVEQAGILSGMPDGTFQPDIALSRAEAVTILNRILDRGPLPLTEGLPWKDVPADHWAVEDINEATINHSYLLDAAGTE